MVTITKDYLAALDRIYADSPKLHQLVHGPATGEGSLVDTDGGPQPTMAKAVGDAKAAMQVETDKLHEIVQGDADTIVETESGPQPSVAKAIADQIKRIDDETDGYVVLARAQAEAAAASASDASATQGAINNRHYGSRDSDPLLRPDGSPCQGGDDYFNSTLKQSRVFDGVSWRAQVSPTDSSQVSYLPPGPGVVALTMSDALGLLAVDILTRIPKSEWSNIAGRISNYDCSPALAACLATGKRVTISMPGRYKFKTPYSGTTDFDVEAQVPGVEFDVSAMPAGTPVAIQNSGSLEQIQSLSADLGVGSRVVNFTTAPPLAVGDWFCIYNPTPSSWSTFRTYYNAGEWCQVAAISGTAVTVSRPLYDSYAAANVSVYKLRPVACRIANIKCIGGANTAQLVLFSLTTDARFISMSAMQAQDSAFGFDRCVGGLGFNLRGLNTGGGINDYFVVIGNSQHIRIEGGDLYARRHAVVTGGAPVVGGVPCRDIRINNRAILRNDPTTGDPPANFHGNTEDSSYEDCEIYGGVTLAGKNTFVRRCKVTGRQTIGVVVHFGEVVGGTLGVIDSELTVPVDPQPFTRGILNIGGNEIGCIDVNTVQDVTIAVRGCSVKATNLTNLTSLVAFVNRGSTKKVNFDIQDVSFDVNSMGQMLYTRLDTGVAASDRIVIDNIKGAPSGLLLHNANSSTYLNFPHRLHRQAGVWSGVTPASTILIAAPFSLPLVYPRTPSVALGISGKAGAVFNGSVGGQTPNVSCYQISGAAVRPQIRAAAAMTAGDTFDVHWTAEIREC